MAISAGTIFECRTTATASNVNSGGFNPTNANFLTDLTTNASTGNTASPVCSSASYNFVAGDVGAWLYIQGGTDWIPGWYQITSVASNKATVNATIGSAVINSNGYFQASTVLGIATVGTPTSGTFGIDYSQQDTAKLAITDLVIDGAQNTKVSSALTPFHVAYVGNLIHTTAGTGFTQGWFEIVDVSGATASLDRSAGTLGSTGGTSKLGGALSLNSTLDDDFFEVPVGGNSIFFKNGTFTLGETVSIASSSPTGQNPISNIGYNSLRGDNPTGSNRPVITCGANTFTVANYRLFSHIIVTGTGNPTFSFGVGNNFHNCKFINTSTTANRSGASTTTNYQFFSNCEFISQNGYGIHSSSSAIHFHACQFHDSNIGAHSELGSNFTHCLSYHNRTAQLELADGARIVQNCTLYGRSSKIGIGISLAAGAYTGGIFANIITGCVTGISQATSQYYTNRGRFNNFYNNTTDVSNYTKDATDTALDQQFTGVTEISGTTATTSGSVLTQSGGDFSSVEDNVDYLHILSGTGVTANTGYLITSHTADTLTVNNTLGTSGAGDVTYFVTTARNFQIGTNLKAAYSVALNGSTTSYIDTGGAQREEVASGGGACVFIS